MNLKRRFSQRGLLIAAACCVLSSWLASNAMAQEPPDRIRRDPPALTVTGRGETSAAPDRATIQLGAVAESAEAAQAQAQVNDVVQRILKALGDLKLPENKIKTARVTLSPVYESAPGPRERRRIVGYRAQNTLQLEIDDLQRIGAFLDTAVAAGATQVESLTFQLKDDLQYRQTALRLAAEEARAKAETLAAAMGLRLRGVREVIEGGVHLVHPRIELAQSRLAFGVDQATPVQPGEVQVEASVTVRYDVVDSNRPGF
jgi:uncharacterized protein YggE